MSHWLITGGGGFIGSHIAETLVKKGESVRILDNFYSGNRNHLTPILNRIELIEGDIRDKKIVEKAMQGIDYVLHQAALRSVPLSIEIPEECNSINGEGLINCLIGAQRAKVKRFVLASSSSIYGDTTLFPQKETHLPAPISPYAASKIAGEHYLNVWANSYGLSTVSLRYFNVFGPRQDPKSKYAAVIPKFIIQALKNEPLDIHWDGKQSRDFTYVTNVVDANITAALSKKDLRGDAFNVACGNSTSLLAIVSTLEKILKRKLAKNFHPKRDGDVRKTWGDDAKIKRVLKYKPAVSFAEGLKRTFEFFHENNRWQNY